MNNLERTWIQGECTVPPLTPRSPNNSVLQASRFRESLICVTTQQSVVNSGTLHRERFLYQCVLGPRLLDVNSLVVTTTFRYIYDRIRPRGETKRKEVFPKERKKKKGPVVFFCRDPTVLIVFTRSMFRTLHNANPRFGTKTEETLPPTFECKVNRD